MAFIDGKSPALFPQTAKVASRIVGFVQISRKDVAVRNGKFVLTVNTIITSTTRAKTWLILVVCM